MPKSTHPLTNLHSLTCQGCPHSIPSTLLAPHTDCHSDTCRQRNMLCAVSPPQPPPLQTEVSPPAAFCRIQSPLRQNVPGEPQRKSKRHPMGSPVPAHMLPWASLSTRLGHLLQFLLTLASSLSAGTVLSHCLRLQTGATTRPGEPHRYWPY